MAETTTTTASAVLKINYIGPIRNQLNKDTILMDRIKKSSREVSGSQVNIPLWSSYGSGVGARTEGDDLPAAGGQSYDVSTFTTKNIYGRFQVSGKTIRATRNDTGAFVRITKAEMMGKTTAMSRQMNRMHFVGSTGVIATENGGGANSATQTFDRTQYFHEDQIVTFSTAGNATVSSIDDANRQVTFTAAINVASGETVTVEGATSGEELNGLAQFAAITGAVQNLNPATAGQGFWAGQVRGADASPVQWNELTTIRLIHDIRKKGGKPDYCITSYEGLAEIFNVLSAQRQFVNTVKLKGGFDAIIINGMPVVADDQCQVTNTVTRLYAADTSNLGHYTQESFHWMDYDGNVVSRVADKDAYEATLVWDGEFATDARNHVGVQLGVQVNS